MCKCVCAISGAVQQAKSATAHWPSFPFGMKQQACWVNDCAMNKGLSKLGRHL